MVFYYHRPLSAMYADGYRSYMGDIERRYRTTLSKTSLRSDRGDLGLYTFAGSHLHGGTPASEKIFPIRSRGYDLYAPLYPTLYGGHYYDYLRGTSPEPRKTSTKSSSLLDEPYYSYYTSYPTRRIYDIDYRTTPTKVSTDFLSDNDLKKTTTKTTTTETWVPLTTYMYNTPYHTYYYKGTPFSSYTYRTADDLYNYDFLNDYRRYSTKTTSKNIDALDLSSTSKYEYSSFMDKCSNIQSQLNEVKSCVSEAESKIRNEVSTSRNKVQTDLAELAYVVDDTAKYNDELYKAIRKQAKQISTLSNQYQDINRNISNVADTLERTRTCCQNLQSDLTSVQSSLEMASKRTGSRDYYYSYEVY